MGRKLEIKEETEDSDEEQKSPVVESAMNRSA